MSAKETCCTHCSHLHVCALKTTFIAAQEAVDRVHITVMEDTAEPISSIEFIKPVNLECIYFVQDIAPRTETDGTDLRTQKYQSTRRTKNTFGTMEIH